MKIRLLFLALLLVSCGKKETRDEGTVASKDAAQIEELVASFHRGLGQAYNEGGINTDSLIDAYFEKGIQYIAPWGWTEPIDSTKSRLRNAVNHVKDYSARVEALDVKMFGSGAYAFFILRQNTSVDGMLLEEYLPTTFVFERRAAGWKIVHAHRSTDYQTFEQWIAMQKKKSITK
jgi:hypothetical protein